MSLREVAVCDYEDTFGNNNCAQLAVGVCCLCKHDVCNIHGLDYALMFAPVPADNDPAHAHVRICHNCVNRLRSKWRMTILQPILAELVEQVATRIAAQLGATALTIDQATGG